MVKSIIKINSTCHPDLKNTEENLVLKSLSLRTKVIIMLVCTLIGVFIIVQNAIENRRKETELKTEMEQQLKQTQESKLKKAEEQRITIEENNKKIEEQKQKEERQRALEDKNNNALSLFNSYKYDNAISISEEVIKEDPQNYTAYNIKGISLCYKSKFEEGMKNIDKALELKGDYSLAIFNKALAYELFAHYSEALEWYHKALQTDKNVWSYYRMASIYSRQRDAANAIKNLKMAIDKSADIKEEAAKDADFNNIRESKEFQELIKK